MTNLSDLFWPASQLGDAINALAMRNGLIKNGAELPNPSNAARRQLGDWIETAAPKLGLEAEEVGALYGEVEQMILNAGPALLRAPGEQNFLAVLGGRRGKVCLLAPDLTARRVPIEAIRSLLCREHEESLRVEVDEMMRQAGVSRNRLALARAAIYRQRLSRVWVNDCWMLRLRPSAGFVAQLRQARLPRLLGVLAGAYAFQFGLGLLAWSVLGRGLLDGQFGQGWLIAWALLLLTAAPFRLLAVWAQGRFAIGAGSLLKQRLLYGALKLQPEEVRHEGAGQMLGRVIESNAVESLALSGGFLGVVAVIELIAAAMVLSIGAAGWPHVLALLACVMLAAFFGWRNFRRRRDWAAARLEMTNDLTERMVGHRTRLAQESPDRWHDGEDQSIEAYLSQSTTMDRAAVMQSAVARSWMVASLLVLSSSFIGGAAGAAALAVSLGGMLLAYRALTGLAASLSSLLNAAVAWEQVKPLLRAAARDEESGSSFELAREGAIESGPVIEASDLAFRYRERGEPILRGLSLRIEAGDRLLLEGSSGGGKSTLAALLTGARQPESGLLLAGGLDRQTLGETGWRRRVVSAPQFHENHVFTGTFAFNLLMGRQWPARAEDFEEAETLCRQLGLGELLDKMPAGMQQMVGETGWQLSHGERSRLFMARALLQRADLVILDESFGALDPTTLRRCLQTALERANTLMVIAHP
ncbi:MAG TPA: ATP-binding cassette domain-containing protein [Blastocatellia bacterium]|nr:ATP-binding cassette domain-containing protein [Blastocatellia bacterium]